MHEIARKISDFLIDNGALEDKRKVYEYALICLFNELIIDIILLFSAAFMSAIPEMIMWIIVFNSLRMNIGGFHANTPEMCSFLSYILGICSVLLGGKIKIEMSVIVMVLILSIVIVYKIAPVVHPKRPINTQQKNVARKMAVIFLGGWGMVWIILYQIWMDGVMCGIMAIIGAITLMIIGKMRLQI